MEEKKFSKTAIFLTLTYDNEHEPWGFKGYPMTVLPFKDAIKEDDFKERLPMVFKRDLQLFLKRLRKKIVDNEKVSKIKGKGDKIKYFITAEYGEHTKRPHYHCLLFNAPKDLDYQEIWKNGMVHTGNVETGSVHYVTKYCINRIGELQGKENCFSVMSKGIGASYVERAGEWHKKEKRFFMPGKEDSKIPLPRYYREKIFNGGEKLNHRKEVIKELDKKVKEEIEKSFKIMDNYFEVDLNRKKLRVEKFKKLNEKDKL